MALSDEIKQLERELRQTSMMNDAVRSAQSRLISTMTRHSDTVSKSIIAAAQETKNSLDESTARKKRIELLRKQLLQAQQQNAADVREMNQKNADFNNFRTANQARLNALQSIMVRTKDEQDALDDLIKQINDLENEYDKSVDAEKRSREATEQLTDQLEAKTKEAKTLKFQTLLTALNETAGVMQQLTQSVRATQQQFGVSAGSAAKINFENLKSSVDSFASALLPGGKSGPGVTMQQIAQAQEDFQEQFGGVLTSEAATKMAQEAVRMGVTTQQLAEARRVFLTQTGGDANKAQAQTDKFISEFAKKGLSSKTAMQEIAKNSELLAKNGTRFSTQMVKALADAKKIGVELSKISQFGDNLISDFEGFLESQAELGAMGFGFDSSRLAEIAETGSDADLFNELRSQLAATGKDITKLRRSERLALENAFGINISDMLKMSGETPEGGGEDTIDPAELQKDANEKLGDLINRTEAAVVALGALGSALGLANIFLGLIERNTSKGFLDGLLRRGRRGGTAGGGGGGGSARTTTARQRLTRMRRTRPGIFRSQGIGGRVRTAGRGLINRVASSRVGTLAGRMASSRAGTVAASVMKGGASLASRLAAPLTGLYTAYQEYKGQKAEGTGTGTAAAMGAVKGTGVFAGMVAGAKLGGTAGGAAGSAAFGVGAVPGAIAGSILGGIAGAFAGDKLASWVNNTITKPFSGALDKAGTSIGSMWNSFTGWFSAKPAAAKPKVTKGDDVVSRPGYGKRTLLTPNGAIALNNKDNIIAYADDMVGTKKLPYGSIAQTVANYGPLAASVFERGKNTFGDKGLNAVRHLMQLTRGNVGLNKFDFLPRTVNTALGKVSKFAPAATKLAAQNIKAIPIVGSMIGGGLTAYDEYKTSGSVGRAAGKGTLSAVGGTLGSILGGMAGVGNPITAAAGGVAGSTAGESLFDRLFKRPVKKADDYISYADDFMGGKKLPLGTISRLASTYKQGGMSGLRRSATETGMGIAGNKISGFNRFMPQASNLYGSFRQGGAGALQSTAINSGLGFLRNRIPSVSQAVDTARQGGVSGLKSAVLNRSLGFLSNRVPGLSGSMDTLKQGGVGGLKSGLLSKGLGFLGNRVPAATDAVSTFRQGGTSGLKSGLLSKGLGLLGNKIPGLSSSVGAVKQGGTGGLKSSLLSRGAEMIGKKVPGLSGALNLFSSFKRGGTKGALGSAAQGGIGKLIGGAIGTAIPIPGVGTAIGSLMGSKVGKLVGGLFGRRKQQTPQVNPAMMGAGNVPDLATMMGSQALQKGSDNTPQPTAPAKIDTAGIEQKLNNFITALQGIQIHMDGTKVGKVLVNTADVASSTGVFKAQSR